MAGGELSRESNLCVTFHRLPFRRYHLRLLSHKPPWSLTSLSRLHRAVASMSIPTEWLTFKTATSMKTPLVMCACIFELSLTFHPAPLWIELDFAFAARRAVASVSMEWLTLKAAISMTTPLGMCARLLPLPRHFLHRPAELPLELTVCCTRARDFRVAVCECSHFEPSAAFPPSPH